MSGNQTTKIYVFTERQLREHDLNIAKAVHEASVKHTARKMVKMNSGQQLKAMTDNCQSLKLSENTLTKIVDAILDEENKKS
jgi:ABC-type transporter MlaC component